MPREFARLAGFVRRAGKGIGQDIASTPWTEGGGPVGTAVMYVVLGLVFVALLPLALAMRLVVGAWRRLVGEHRGSAEMSPGTGATALPVVEKQIAALREPDSDEDSGFGLYIATGFWAWVGGSIGAHYLLGGAHQLDHRERTIATILIFTAFVPWAPLSSRLIPAAARRAAVGGVSSTKTAVGLAGVSAYGLLTAAVPLLIAVLLRSA